MKMFIKIVAAFVLAFAVTSCSNQMSVTHGPSGKTISASEFEQFMGSVPLRTKRSLEVTKMVIEREAGKPRWVTPDGGPNAAEYHTGVVRLTEYSHKAWLFGRTEWFYHAMYGVKHPDRSFNWNGGNTPPYYYTSRDKFVTYLSKPVKGWRPPLL